MYSSGTQHMDISREDAQKRPTFTNWWMTQDAELKNYQLQWSTETEKGGGSVSWNTEQARPDNDDDDDASFFFIIPIKNPFSYFNLV